MEADLACAWLSCITKTFSYVGRVKSSEEGVWPAPLTADHHVVAGLIPEVVAERRTSIFALPVSNYVKSLSVQENESTCTHQCEGNGPNVMTD